MVGQRETVLAVLQQWENDGVMTRDKASIVEKNIDTLMEMELREIEALVDEAAAFARFIRLISFVNVAALMVPSIIKKLEKWVKRLMAAANALAKKLQANGFSISAGLPVGVSVGLSFPIT